MSYRNKQITASFKRAHHINIEYHPKIVIMSDCHRGTGTWADNFNRNKTLFIAALKFYNHNNFTYIELGDGDELWENRNFKDIFKSHKEIFDLFIQYELDNRIFLLFGNHDRIKENAKYTTKNFEISIPFYESIIIHRDNNKLPLYLFHGYQGDFINDSLWKISRSLVRHLWKPLELKGFQDPTSAAKNYTKNRKIENSFIDYSCNEPCILIAGHTHRPGISNSSCGQYLNSGSCIHPSAITALEIENDYATLIKWSTCVDANMKLYVCKEVLKGPVLLI